MRDDQHRGTSHDQAVAALFAWQLADPEDQAEFARNDDFVMELAAEAASFFGELHLNRVLAVLDAGHDARAGWADWRVLCERRAADVLHDRVPQRGATDAIEPSADHAPAA